MHLDTSFNVALFLIASILNAGLWYRMGKLEQGYSDMKETLHRLPRRRDDFAVPVVVHTPISNGENDERKQRTKLGSDD